MPQLSQWAIRTSFIYLLLGFTIGALLLTHKGVPLHPALWSWLPVHIELLFMGWIVQFTMGVGFWILPRFWVKPRRPRVILAKIAFILLNLGIWLVIASTAFPAGGWLLLAGRSIEAGAVFFFALHAWARIVSRDG